MNRKLNSSNIYITILIFSILLTTGCTSSHKKGDSEINDENFSEELSKNGKIIIETAKEEQNNPMYSPEVDTTILYWLENKIIILENATKCNIYALNTLYKAGFMCPKDNTLTRDLMDTVKYNEIFPVIKIEKYSDIKKGDLIVWNGHVIIFDSLIIIKNVIYAMAYWAGTRQEDNKENIINNVSHGKYKLEGNFIIRRPKKRI
ncbi:MAG: hypothetical protein FJ216_06935 [Ignavibacteria bacterium]|nr:hypothetical protein [Ignavibacteria bacterium]